MAHYAKINKQTRLVENVIVADKDFISSLDDCEDWIQTSYNAKIRKNYAGIGMLYDPINDWFVGAQPYPSWTLDSDAKWQSPTPRPTDGKFYTWNEETLSWDEVTN